MTSSRETVLCQYHYDPLDRLISHELSEISERKRFYCKSRLATEIQGTLRYSIVQYGDQLLAQQRREGDSADTTLLATDQQRSVLEALKANHPVQSIAYSPYGNRTDEGGLLNLLAFNGERPDPVTRCYLLGNGYRAFNPVLMRFNSPDSWSPFGKGGLNAYTYCIGDPINRSDPNGRSSLLRYLNTRRAGIITEAGKTRTINLNPFSEKPYIYKLRPDTTPEKAFETLEKILNLHRKNGSIPTDNKKFTNDLKNLNSINPLKRTPTENTRLKLLEYLKETPSEKNNFSKFSLNKLYEATNNDTNPNLPDQSYQFKLAAKSYFKEFQDMKSTFSMDLHKKANTIRDEHFIKS